jgi:hypothetical protein
MIYLSRHLRYLVDPLTGADLQPCQGGVCPSDAPSYCYPIQDEVLRLSRRDLSAESQAYDAACRQAGKQAPTPDQLMALPRQALAGWGSHYWAARALSLAGIWEWLEAERRRLKRPCVGFQGGAAVLSPNLPYIAYGLEVGGYATYALSPHAGEYGLAAYRQGRYGRIHTAWEALPLRPQKFEVIILAEVLPSLTLEQGQALLRQAVRALTPTGSLIVTDSPNAEAYRSWVQGLGLQTHLMALRGLEDHLSARVRSMLGQGLAVPPLLIGRRTI